MKFSQLKLNTPYLELNPLFYDKVKQTSLDKPFVISLSNSVAQLLGIDEDLFDDEKLLEIINGSTTLDGSTTFGMCYAGHQFGHFVPRLGDGRAINLGKVNGQNLQVKGAGQTLYSRSGDGRAVLRSSIREYLMSEAMHGLGIATSRALALIGSDTDVARETSEKGALVLRLSPTWVRFGTFEYFNSIGDLANVEKLADYVIDESFPHLKNENGMYLKMYEEIVRNTALTIASWQSVGFNHGVMNTDNMSIDGRTIDYGPFAFLDDYEADYVCNHTDVEGRYSFSNQPEIAKWNLSQLAVALSSIVNYDKSIEILEEVFSSTYVNEYLGLMYNKLGFDERYENDIELIRWMLGALQSSKVDYTTFFRKLSSYDGVRTELFELCELQAPLSDWLDAYDVRVANEELSKSQREELMLSVNPKYILKNHILQEAIDKAQENDFSMIDDLLKVALAPYDEHIELEYLCKKTPEKSKNIKLSCSS